MPALANSRHERFAQELAKGKSADEAYQLAGYEANRGNATRLKTNESVQARVEELQERSAQKVEVTVESLIAELEEARAQAKQLGQAAPQVSATFAKARILGMVVEKREDVTPIRSASQIESRIRQLVGRSDEDRAVGSSGGIGNGGAPDQTVPTVPGHGTA